MAGRIHFARLEPASEGELAKWGHHRMATPRLAREGGVRTGLNGG